MKICLLSCFFLSNEIVFFLNELKTILNKNGFELVVLSQKRQPMMNAPSITLPYSFKDFDILEPGDDYNFIPGNDHINDLVKTDMIFSGEEARSFTEHLRGYYSCRYILERLISSLSPSIGFVWGISHPQSRLLANLLEEKKIPTYILERGIFADTLMVEPISSNGESFLNRYPIIWDKWVASDDYQSYKNIKEYYLKNKPQKYSQDDYISSDTLRETFYLKGKQVVVFWGQHDIWSGIVPRETHRSFDLSPFFVNTEEALRKLSEVIDNIPSVSLLFKPHPHDKNDYNNIAGKSTVIARNINNYNLFDLADVFVAMLTTTQFEALLHEKPIIIMANSQLKGKGIAYEYENGIKLEQILEHALNREGYEEKLRNSKKLVSGLFKNFLYGYHPYVPTRNKVTEFSKFIRDNSLQKQSGQDSTSIRALIQNIILSFDKTKRSYDTSSSSTLEDRHGPYGRNSGSQADHKKEKLSKHEFMDKTSDVRLIAFYLPQYHPIPENDEWWGKGFTEWTNVTKAKPLFPGHYQPHMPADLGFYDLRLPEVREAQAEMAKRYGISGFCYYHYWFNGKRLLNRVFDEVMVTGKPDFPFCLCWANENWTRAWDGGDKMILMGQQYSQEDDLAHIKWLIRAFRDPRYIKIHGRPLFLIYRVSDLPDPEKTASLWRDKVKQAGFPDFYLCKVESFSSEHTDIYNTGFDAAVEFQPDWSRLSDESDHYPGMHVFEYSNIVKNMIKKAAPGYTRFPCVTPSWDNSPRKQKDGHIFHNSQPALYEKWLRHALSEAGKYATDERIVFINAWNEWGEGNHLEPDKKYGHAYLRATKRALTIDLGEANLNDELTEKASIALDRGLLVEANQLLVEALYHNPDAPRTLHRYAILKHQQGETEQAIPLLERAIVHDPGNSEFANDLGVLHYHTGNKDKAFELFQMAVELDVLQIDARKNLADLHFNAGRFMEAENIYKEILSIHPDETEVLTALTRVYKTLGCLDDASDCHSKIAGISNKQSRYNPSPVTGVSMTDKDSIAGSMIQEGVCNICGSQKGFSLTNPENPRESWVCLSCGSTSRDRMYIYALSSTLMNPSPLINWPENTSISVLEASGARAHPGILKTKFNYLNTQYNPEKMTDSSYDRRLYADLQDLFFDDNSFDVVMSSDVFEHIRLHKEALKEIYRVLKPGGVMILQAPFHPENRENIIRVRPEGDKDVFLCPPMYHDEDTLVYRVYGAELISEIESTGFIVQAIEDEIPRHRITRQNIILAQKPGSSAIAGMKIKNERPYTSSYTGVSIKKVTIDSNKSLLASIVIPVFNQVEYTRQCLDGIKKHTPEDIYEIIIVDNNSTDRTREYLSTIVGNVKIITNKENQGFTIACNQGAREAQGKYIVFLNNDTIPLDGWLTTILDTFKLNDDIGAVGSKLVYPDMKVQEAGGIIFSDGNGWNFGKGDLADHGRYNKLIEVDYCSGASLAVRKDLFDLVGGFDEIYAPAYYEDTDLCFGIREKGYRVLYQPESEVIHYEGKTAGSSNDSGFKRYQLINQEKFQKKWAHRLKDQGPSPYEGAPKPFTADRHRRLAGYVYSKHINNFEMENTAGIGKQINFLIIDPFLPIYDKASGSFRLFQIVKILADTPQVHVTYIARSGHHGDKYVKLLTSLGIEVYHTDPEKLFSFNLLGYRHLINLKYILSKRHYHYAFLSFYEIALQYLPDIRLYSPDTRVIIDTVDIHFLREMRQAELFNDEKMIRKAMNTKKNETSIYQKADALITVTDKDADTVRPYFPDRPIHVIPNIHPLQHGNKPFNKRSGLIFIGNYSHPPNIDAVEYYIKEIHPKIQEKKLFTPVSIIGDGLPEHVKSLAKGLKNITFIGWVPETKPYLDQARISIAPLRYGAGMKGKIGEALAAGLPVVTTPIGAEGVDLTHGQDILIANSADEFADMISELYRDAALWEKLSANGIRFIEQNYSTSAVADKVRRIFRLPIPVTSSHSKEQDLEKKTLLTSIIILCFNQLEYTKKCLQSIMKYTSEPYELILVDNGSTDGTQSFLEEYAKMHPECKVILNKENRGFAGGNNQGIAAAKGDYILLLNNDVIVTQDWLERLIAHIESDENIGMIGPVSNSISGLQLVENTGYGKDLKKMHKFAHDYSKKNAGRTQDIMRLAGFCLLIKKVVIDIIGGLDENYTNGNYEDDDLCLRSSIAGFRNIIARDIFIHHYGSMTFKGNKMDYTDSLEGNRRRFADKWKDIVEVNGNEYRTCLTREQQLKILIEWGEERFSRGNFNAAVKIFERVLKLDKTNSQAMNNLGVIQWQISREPASAMKTFQAALTLNPKDGDALGNLVQLATETGRLDLINRALLDTLKKAHPANPDLVTLTNAQLNSEMTA